MTTADAAVPAYPARLDIDYPEGPRNRLTVAFRFLLIIPIVIVLSLLSGGAGSAATGGVPARGVAAPASFVARIDDSHGLALQAPAPEREGRDRRGGVARGTGRTFGVAGGVVVLPTVLMLVFRQKYPRWWFDWNRELYRFGNRVCAYGLLLRDEYPSTDEEQAVHAELDYPDAMRLNRWLPLVKWLLAIPHYIVLAFLAVAVVVVTLVAWLVILVTGRYPQGMFDFVVGVMRWGLRVSAYAFLLVTDRYPPFALR